jgi:transcriptional regulator with XRE-family HTH domain
MTLDEVVAANVRRIRESHELSVAELAERMGVGRHLVYDMERPRPGAEQRQFTFWDLVSLCSALGTTLFELVLPPKGVVVYELETGENSEWTRAARRAGLNEVAEAVYGDGRTKLGWVLFGMDGSNVTPESLEVLMEAGQTEAARREAFLRGITAEMWKLIKEEME